MHPGGEHVFEQAVGQEVPVSRQQVTGGEPAQQLAGQRLLPGGQRGGRGAQHRPGAAFAEAGHADLRERAAPAVIARIAELGGVLRRVRKIQAHPVHRDQPHPRHERALLLLPGQRPGHLLQQGCHHLPAQPLARIRDRRRRRLHPQRHAHPEPPRPVQARDQLVPHLRVTGIEEQHHRQQVIHHHPRRQRARTLLAHARLLDDPVHQLRREHLRQHADPDPVRQPVPGHHLLPWSRHADDLTPL